MENYKPTNSEIWTGRKSDQKLYLHEKVQCIDFEKDKIAISDKKRIGVLGYACDEGVKRNHGRVGATEGPLAIRRSLAKMPNHLSDETTFLDIGDILCLDERMEDAQAALTTKVSKLLKHNIFPILLGGGHDMAYGHYNGLKKHVGLDKTIGIINFDAHFDLRSNENGNTSGTPFYQIAKDCEQNGSSFNYLCLGIRKDANDKILFQTAKNLNVSFIENHQFSISKANHVVRTILDFIREVDFLYVTIDLDGFSSAYAPGVSAASPLGFTPTLVLETLQTIIASKKLLSIDFAEMNPKYDTDGQTAKLAASLIHFVLHEIK